LTAESIARNYAEALFELAHRGQDRVEQFADLLDAVAHGIAASPRVQAVLMSPRVTKAAKAALLERALKDAPRDFVRFLTAVVKRGRQGLFSEMAHAYQGLVDIKLNRVRAQVTLSRPADAALRKKIAARLTEVVGKEVLPHYTEDPALLGGIIVRVGDRVFDGSIRRRMTLLRRALLTR